MASAGRVFRGTGWGLTGEARVVGWWISKMWGAKFRRARKASTAVEFALVGSVAFMIICALFALSIDMYWQFTMDTALRNAARNVQIQKTTTGAEFAARVCSELGIVAVNCTNSLQYSVQTGTYFGSASDTASILGNAGALTSNGLSKPANFSTITSTALGQPQFMLVQVALPVPFSFFNGLNPVVTQNGTNYLYAAVTTVVEP